MPEGFVVYNGAVEFVLKMPMPMMTIILNHSVAAAVTKRTRESREPAGGLGWESSPVL